MLNTRDAIEVLERDFLEARCKILEIAAILDRIDRAAGAARSTPGFTYESSPTGAGSTDRGRPGPGRDHSAHLLARVRSKVA